MHAMPQVPSGMQLHPAPRVLRPIPQHPARRNMHTSSPRAHGACIFSFCLAVGEFLICVAQCALPCLIIKNIVDNAGLPTAYGINQHIKIAFVLLLVPTVACWYAFLGSGLRGEQSYSPTRPMVFRRGTPSVVKELLSGLGFALTQSALLWLVIRPMLAVNGASAFCWKMAGPCSHMASGPSAALSHSRFPARGALHVRHIPARTSWRIRHRPGNQRRESLT